MKTRTLIAAGVLALSASLAGPSIAQDLTINGAAVPAGELEAVQMKCEELMSQQATALAQPSTAATPAAEAPAAGASDDVAATESAAETPVEPAATAVAEAPAEGNMAAETPATGAATTIDLASLTAELCADGGFEIEAD